MPNPLAPDLKEHLNYCVQGWRGSLVSENIFKPRTLASRFLGMNTGNLSRDAADKAREKIAAATREANTP